MAVLVASLACLGAALPGACQAGARAPGSCGETAWPPEGEPSISLLQHGRSDHRRRAADNKTATRVLTAKVSSNSSESLGGCPTVAPLSAADGFSLTEYVRASWYPQEQQTVAYQQNADLFNCLIATYDDLGSVSGDLTTIPLYCGSAVAVYNFCEGASCTPTLQNGVPRRFLCAAYLDPTRAALRVLPCFLPEFLGGNYWVVAIGEDTTTNQYEWALVSGGQPTVQYSDGCTTNSGPLAYFDAGFWILSRTPVLDPAKLAEAKSAATSLGYTLSQLQPVIQGGSCTYAGAYIKP